MTFNKKEFLEQLNQQIDMNYGKLTIDNQQKQMIFEKLLILLCQELDVIFHELNPECLIISVKGKRVEYDLDELCLTVESHYLEKWYDEYLDFESYYC